MRASSAASSSNVSNDARSSAKHSASCTPGILRLTRRSGAACSAHCTWTASATGSHAAKKGVAAKVRCASSLAGEGRFEISGKSLRGSGRHECEWARARDSPGGPAVAPLDRAGDEHLDRRGRAGGGEVHGADHRLDEEEVAEQCRHLDRGADA